MPGALPEGEDVPVDGSLPAASIARLGEQPFGVYVHVPFCAVRCGYCDFNTYTATELGGGASQAAYAATAAAELRLARRVWRVGRRLRRVRRGRLRVDRWFIFRGRCGNDVVRHYLSGGNCSCGGCSFIIPFLYA